MRRLKLALSVALILQATSTFAEDTGESNSNTESRAPAASSSSADEEYNFSWLDPDKKIYVLQNRKYRKARRSGIFASGGTNLSNPYRTEYLFTGRGGFWFTEQFGLEAFYSYVTNRNSDTLTELRNANSNALPFVRDHLQYYGALFSWTPWYAKLNFFNQILYYDWFLNAGIGRVHTQVDTNRSTSTPSKFVKEDFISYYYGTGMNFFLHRNFVIRFDLTGMTYRAKGSDNISLRWIFNYDMSLGLGFLFL